MTDMITLQNPEQLEVYLNGRTHFGFNQLWYTGRLKRNAGCGPTAASTLLYYLNKRNQDVLPYQGGSLKEIVKMMEDVWKYITPGFMGLNSAAKFKNGMEKLFHFYHLNWKCHTLDAVPRQSYDIVKAFVQEALKSDCPVAFLNLHRGAITMFESWHWIVLTGFTGEDMVTAFDDGKSFDFNLKHWVNTTKLGGGFAYITE